MIELTLTDVETLVPNIETIGVDGKVVAYRFTGGEYEGIAYTYANIRFNVWDVEKNAKTDIDPNEVEPGDERYALQVGFEYVILENPAEIKVESQPFKEYIGEVLVKIVEGSLGD